MSLFATIRRRRYSAFKLSWVAVAWLSLVASPCSEAFLPDGQHIEANGKNEIHSHSHEQTENPTLSEDCCCDQLDAVKTESSKPYQFVPLLGMPVDQLFGISTSHAGSLNFEQNFPVHNNSPPLFLRTQRIRL